MKKWHLEEVLHLVSSKKLVLPDLGQTTAYRPLSIPEIRKEPLVIRCCRKVVVFFIRRF